MLARVSLIEALSRLPGQHLPCQVHVRANACATGKFDKFSSLHVASQQDEVCILEGPMIRSLRLIVSVLLI